MNEANMKFKLHIPAWLRRSHLVAVFALSLSLGACSGDSWKEEVLLQDGSKVVVERMMERKGRHEIGQSPFVTTNRLAVNLPGFKDPLVWEMQATPDIGYTELSPIALGVQGSQVYLVAKVNACLAYNKWGRPNPPYVVFKHVQSAWRQIPLAELPVAIFKPNLLISSADQEVKRIGKSLINSQTIAQVNGELDQPEFKTILREKLPEAKMLADCELRVQYKGRWVLPNDDMARKFIDSQEKK
jgi:hypothetical protein